MIVPLAVLGIVMAMIVPVPSLLLDLLISANITISVVVLLVAMHISRPVEFSVFPTALLLLTLFRLALNVSSARLILTAGNRGTRAAGEVIEAFGNFVVGGNYVVGVVIFLVLIAIQYVVINHGAVRISEVTARFTLDALPGKQMSIDADLNAGLIDEGEAKSRRKMLASEAEFYGAMDGASRFTQRDAVASILITAINILAGFLIGVLQNGMDLTRALSTYTVLTIGDGLVTVIPALMVSVSGGLIVTRASSDDRLGTDVGRQIFGQSRPLLFGGAVLGVMALLPGLPTIPFLALGSAVGYFGWRLKDREANDAAEGAQDSPDPSHPSSQTPPKLDPLGLEVGLGLVRLADGGKDSALLRRISSIRTQLGVEIGFVVPPVRIADNLQLGASEYAICLRGAEIARGELMPGHDLAIRADVGADGGNASVGSDAGSAPDLAGVPAKDPAFGMPAVWITPEKSDRARALGYTVVDAVSVLGTHLAEVIRRHAWELLSRQETKTILDQVAQDNPKVVEDLVPKLMPLATVQRVFQNLLRERVSIRDSVTICEALSDAGASTKNPVLLTEFARQAVRRGVVKPYLTHAGELPALVAAPQLEQLIESGIEYTEQSCTLRLGPVQVRDIASKVDQAAGPPSAAATIVTSSPVRFFLRQILEQSRPQTAVLSHSELPPGVRVLSLGTVG